MAVRWYLRNGLSYRDVEELLAERGVTVDHVTVHRWVQRLTSEFTESARPCRHVPGDRWFADEKYVKVGGRWTHLYRAVDQHGWVTEVLLSQRRDLAVAQRFFTCALRSGTVPAEVTTDRVPAYPQVLDELIPLPCTLSSSTRWPTDSRSSSSAHSVMRAARAAPPAPTSCRPASSRTCTPAIPATPWCRGRHWPSSSGGRPRRAGTSPGIPRSGPTSTTASGSRSMSRSHPASTTSAPEPSPRSWGRTSSPQTSPSRCRAGAASSKPAAACSTPAPSTPVAWSPPAAPTTFSTSPRSAGKRSGRTQGTQRVRKVRHARLRVLTAHPVQGSADVGTAHLGVLDLKFLT